MPGHDTADPEPAGGMAFTPMRWPFAAVLALTSACGAAAGGGPQVSPAPAPGSAAEVEAIFQARTDSARLRFTEADVRFAAGMIEHHAQALVMAGLAPANGASPSVRTLAARIMNGQEDEIASMQQWLRDRGQAVPEMPTAAAGHAMHGPDHPADMPGMLTPGQLRQLEQARDTEFDRLFLTFMIQHHRGAVLMVHELFRTDGAAQDEEIFKIASDIQVDQTTEIARMERMLAALPGFR